MPLHYMYNKMVDSPENVKLLSVLAPGVGVETNTFLLYIWFYHITMSNYDIEHNNNITILHHKNHKKKYWRRFTSIFIQ